MSAKTIVKATVGETIGAVKYGVEDVKASVTETVDEVVNKVEQKVDEVKEKLAEKATHLKAAFVRTKQRFQPIVRPLHPGKDIRDFNSKKDVVDVTPQVRRLKPKYSWGDSARDMTDTTLNVNTYATKKTAAEGMLGNHHTLVATHSRRHLARCGAVDCKHRATEATDGTRSSWPADVRIIDRTSDHFNHPSSRSRCFVLVAGRQELEQLGEASTHRLAEQRGHSRRVSNYGGQLDDRRVRHQRTCERLSLLLAMITR